MRVLPSVRVLSGAVAPDTILTPAAQPIVVEVRDTLGRLVPGTRVRFSSARSADSTRDNETPLYVCPDGPFACAPTSGGRVDTAAVVYTNAEGRAVARVQLGTIAGPTWLYVAALDLGAEDSLAFTVLPGAPAGVRIGVADTALYVAASYAPRATVHDRFGNLRADVATLAADDSVVTIGAGSRVSGRVIGRGTITAQYGGFADTSHVSVVPTGRIVAWEWSGPEPNSIVAFDLDGSSFRVVAHLTSLQNPLPIWAPGTDDVVYGDLVAGTQQLMRADAHGAVSPFLHDGGALAWSGEAQFSPDGAAVYFNGAGMGVHGLWRARADGTGVEQVPGGISASQPTVSPDGGRVAYSLSSKIRVLTLATYTVADIDVGASDLHWAPAGERIAYVGAAPNKIQIINADGSGYSYFPTTEDFDGAFDWSPDAQWLVVGGYGRLSLLNVASGALLPLPVALDAELYAPSWKR